MKNYLFISNSKILSKDQYESKEIITLNNFSIPCIEAALDMDYKVFVGINRLYADELQCDLDIKFYNSSIYRSLFDIKRNYTAYKNLINLLKRHHFDVIHCNTPIGGLIGRACGKISKVPKIIYTAHGFHFYKGAPLINNIIIKFAESLMAKHTDAIITINSEDYSAARKFKLRNNGNVYFVHGVGVDTEYFRTCNVDRKEIRSSLGVRDDAILLISAGDLVKRKNYSVSIRSIALATEKNIHHMICGTGPEYDSLKKLTKKLNIDHMVSFLGHRTDIKELMHASDIFLFTTLQEGLPRSMMEAMASGLPCIASEIRGNTDLITYGEGGFLCPPNDAIKFAEYIDILAKDPGLRRSMGEVNIESIKPYDISNVKAEIKKIYEIELV